MNRILETKDFVSSPILNTLLISITGHNYQIAVLKIGLIAILRGYYYEDFY